MATYEERLAAVRHAFQQAGEPEERWLAAYDAVRALEPAPEVAGIDGLLLTAVKPTLPEHVQRLKEEQAHLSDLAADIMASQNTT